MTSSADSRTVTGGSHLAAAPAAPPNHTNHAHPLYVVTSLRGRERMVLHPGTHSIEGAARYADYRRYDARGNRETRVEILDCRCTDGPGKGHCK